MAFQGSSSQSIPYPIFTTSVHGDDQDYGYPSSPRTGFRTPDPALLKDFSVSKDWDEPSDATTFENLSYLTSSLHSSVAKKVESYSNTAFEWACWAAGMKPQAVVKPHQSAIAILNAGEGIGKSLAIKFAERGYTVFALVHTGFEAADEGSLAKLVYMWQRRLAVIQHQRDKLNRERRKNYERSIDFTALGSIVPIPFVPLSPASRDKVHRFIGGHCSDNNLHLRTVILPPVYASTPKCESQDVGNSLSRVDGLGDHSLDLAPEVRVRSHEVEEAESTPMEPEMLPYPRNLLPRHPPSKVDPWDFDVQGPKEQEGSYVPLAAVHQFTWERAVQRDLTEQLLVVQMLADLLIPQDDGPRGRDPPDPYSSSSLPPRPLPFSRSQSSLRDEETARLFRRRQQWDAEILQGIEEESWLFYLWEMSWRMIGFGRKPNQNTNGRILVLTGAGESTFDLAKGPNDVTDAARERLATNLGDELGRLGIHVSLVKTSPLTERSISAADRSLHPIEFDPRSSLTKEATSPLVADRFNHLNRYTSVLAQISRLWALDEDTCFWIIKTASEARYPKSVYNFGVDVLLKTATSFIPTPVSQLSKWFVYEKLRGRQIENWAIRQHQSSWNNSALLSNPIVSLGSLFVDTTAYFLKKRQIRNDALDLTK